MGNVIDLPVITNLDLDPQRVLTKALDAGLTGGVVILGYDKDGDEYFASSISDGSSVLWLMERLKMKLLNVPDREQ